jgi:DNA-binding IclR family transcriptional regulator
MQELVERWGETTHLAVLDGVQVLYVEKLQGTPAAQILLSRIGARLPAHCSSVGKVLLAHQEWRKVANQLEPQLAMPFTPNTIASLETLNSELAKIYQQGYAYDHEEVVLGLCCVAAPIYEADGKVIAAMSISVPAYRFYSQQEHYTEIILKTTHAISHRLGYRRKER